MATAKGASVTISVADDILIRRLREFVAGGGDTRSLMGRLGSRFVDQTQDRFEASNQTDPQGKKWKVLSPGYIKRKREQKHSDLTLVMRGYLQHYITSDVLSENEVVWGSNRVYAAIHNMGGDGTGRNGKMPKRQFLGVSHEDNEEALAIVQDWLHRKLKGLPD